MRKANEILSLNQSISVPGLSARRIWNKRIARILSWGIISLLMYLAVFLNQEIITKYFTQGGFFAIVIVFTALAFAFVYGTFANYVLESLNFKAVNRKKDGH